MKRTQTLLSLFVLSAMFARGASAAHTHVPSPSTWVLNLHETQFGGGPSFKADTDVVLVDNEQRLHWKDVTTLNDGSVGKTSWDGPEDGTLHPIQGYPGAQASWNAADDSEVIVNPDGSEVHAIMTLSADGKKMILTQTYAFKNGKVFHQKLVYDRTK